MNFLQTHLFLLFLLASFRMTAQDTETPRRQNWEIQAGTSLHGTGDTRGFVYAMEYGRQIHPRLCWRNSLGGTIHDGSYPIFFEYPQGVQNDGSVRFTTAGVQVISHLGFLFVNSPRHEVSGNLGAVFRYQSTSYWDIINVFYPGGGTGFPFPVVLFENNLPQRTLSVGGSAQFRYAYTFGKDFKAGLIAGFQYDGNGDALNQLSLSLGRHF